MYNFIYSSQKRQQEQKQLQKLLIASFVGSTVLHGILIVFLPSWLPQKSPEKAEKPIELILVDKPKPKPIETKVVPKPKPKPTPPPKLKTPEPPKPIPTPQAKTPEPPKPKPTPPPKIEQPKQVLTTTNTTATNSVFNPPVTTEKPVITTRRATPTPTPEKTVATTSPTPKPAPAPKPTTDARGISCVANCQPKYPSALNGDEGRAGIRLTIDQNGSVTAAQLAQAHSNAMLNRQALLAARRMKFNKIDNEAGAYVIINISFTVEGSEFERIAKERQAEKERERQAKLEAERKQQEAARLQQEQEAERKRQEAARLQQRAELEKKRQQQLQQQQAPTPALANPSNQTEQGREEEMLRKFRERINNHQNN